MMASLWLFHDYLARQLAGPAERGDCYMIEARVAQTSEQPAHLTSVKAWARSVLRRIISQYED
jgi:hypothetical protein